MVTAPMIPWLAAGEPEIAPPVLTPCPEGWRELVMDGITECAPYPEAGMAACGAGEAHFPGEDGCRPVGDACPAGDFASVSATIYVLASAAPGGDGSEGAPFDTLSRISWNGLGPKTVIALGKGSYGGTLPLRPGVQVIGACAAETILTGVDAPVRQVVTVTAAGAAARIRNVTLLDAPQIGIGLDEGELHAEGVVIDGVRETGVWVSDDARLMLSDVAVRDIALEGAAGYGLLARNGATVVAERLTVSDATAVGVLSISGSAVSLSDAAIVDTHPANGNDGRPVYAEGDTEISLERVLLRRGFDVALQLLNGARATATDLVIDDIRAPSSDPRGYGVSVDIGSTLTAQRVRVTATHSGAFSLLGAGSHTELSDVVIRDMAPTPQMGRGLLIEAGATLTAERIAITRANDFGIAMLTGGHAEVTDLSLRDTRAEGTRSLGVPVAVSASTLEVTRARVEGGRAIGIQAQDEGAEISITDAVIRDNAPVGPGSGGRGTNAIRGGTIRLTRVLIEDMGDAAIAVDEAGSTTSATDVVVRRVTGVGVQAQFMAAFELERVVVEDISSLGIVVSSGATGTVRDLLIQRIALLECPEAECADSPSGHGLVVRGATANVSRARITDVATCGIYVSDAEEVTASFDLEMAAVERSNIGVCISSPGYDLERLTNDVTFSDNTTNLQTDALPLPSLDIGAPGGG